MARTCLCRQLKVMRHSQQQCFSPVPKILLRVCVIQSGFSLIPSSNVTLAYYACECMSVCERDRALFTASIQRRETTGSTTHPSHLLNEHGSDPSEIICVLQTPLLEGKNQVLKSQTEDGGRQRETILNPGRILFGIFLSFSTDFRPLKTLDEKYKASCSWWRSYTHTHTRPDCFSHRT